MERLTANHAKVYEAIKAGHNNLQDVVKATKLTLHSVKSARKLLSKRGIIKIERNGKSAIYVPMDVKYKVHDIKSISKILELPDDPLVDRAFNVQLDEEQIHYLRNHRYKQSRTVLAKKLGISKLTLNFALERLG